MNQPTPQEMLASLPIEWQTRLTESYARAEAKVPPFVWKWATGLATLGFGVAYAWLQDAICPGWIPPVP